MTTAKLMIKPMIRMACAVLFSVTAMVAGADNEAREATNAQNNIKDISYSALQGGKVEVKVTLKQPLSSPPAGFTTNNPPRIALDFPGTTNALGKNSIEVGEGTLRTMNIVQAGNRTRLVLNLAKPVGYETRMDGNSLIVSLHGTATSVSTTNETTRFAEAGAGWVCKNTLSMRLISAVGIMVKVAL
ncbi:MAG: AMIN domain-containing protein [Sulfuricella sp.]